MQQTNSLLSGFLENSLKQVFSWLLASPPFILCGEFLFIPANGTAFCIWQTNLLTLDF